MALKAWIDLLTLAMKSKDIDLKVKLLNVELTSEIQGSLYDIVYAETDDERKSAAEELEKWRKKYKELKVPVKKSK